MRKRIVAGNWKMNMLDDQVTEFLVHLNESKNQIPFGVDLVIFPPFIYLDMLINFPEIDLKTGAQDCSANPNGAFTGEISAEMLKAIDGGSNRLVYTIIGHSERRLYHQEGNELLSAKVNQLIQNSICPVYCCGETLDQREAKRHKIVVESQIKEGLFHLTKEEFLNVVIAYEPVWAIGTGVTATSDQAQDMHLFIRNLIRDQYDEKTAQKTAILYGGSCKPNNAKELFSQPDIDGGLIGGASLKVDSFLAIANSF